MFFGSRKLLKCNTLYDILEYWCIFTEKNSGLNSKSFSSRINCNSYNQKKSRIFIISNIKFSKYFNEICLIVSTRQHRNTEITEITVNLYSLHTLHAIICRIYFIHLRTSFTFSSSTTESTHSLIPFVFPFDDDRPLGYSQTSCHYSAWWIVPFSSQK